MNIAKSYILSILYAQKKKMMQVNVNHFSEFLIDIAI